MKRIALLSVHTSPIAAPGGKKVGGMNTYVREIAREFGQRGIAVDVFTRRTDSKSPAIDASLGENIRVIQVKAGPESPLSTNDIFPHLQQFTAGVIAHAIRHQLSYEMTFSHYWLSGWVAQKLREAWGIPFVQMFHTLGHMKNRIPSVRFPVSDVRIQTEKKVVDWADLIIANTPAERAQLLWLYHADRRRIVVCPPGVNTGLFQPQSLDTARAKLGIDRDENLLLFVGRIEPLKAVDSILESLHILRQRDPELLQRTRFAVIGGDPCDPTDKDMRELLQLRDQLDLRERVTFLGAKSQDVLADYYAAATAVIMPSEYESFGMVALEAMASGTPVIASEVGGLAYLVIDGETGFLVPARAPEQLAERVEKLLKSPQTRDQMGQNAARLAERYTWSSIADRLLEYFNEMKPANARPARVG